MGVSNSLSLFHDAELRSIEIDREDKRIALRFSLADRSFRTLNFSGVTSFRTIDVIMQNVTSRLLISSEHEFGKDDLLRWIRWLTSLSDTESFCTSEQILDIQRKIERGDRLLVVLEPSWGAEIALLARSYTLS